MCLIAGPEFKDREGHLLTIHKALYGLHTSRLHWHERFADCFHDTHLDLYKAEPDIWIRANDNEYAYVTVYVDDLAFAMKDPSKFMKVLNLNWKHQFMVIYMKISPKTFRHLWETSLPCHIMLMLTCIMT